MNIQRHICKGPAAHLDPSAQTQVAHSCPVQGKGEQREEMESQGHEQEARAVAVAEL